MIKINLVREGRAAVRGPAAGAAPAATTRTDLNNVLLVTLIILGLAAAGGWWFTKIREEKAKEEQVNQQRIEAQKLEKIIQEVQDFQKRKDSLEKRIALINQLKQNQKGPVRILDRISQDLPDLVWLDHMAISGTHIDLQGRALNPNAFANYVENLKSDSMFDEPEVRSVAESGNVRGVTVYSWDMSFNFTWVPPGASGATGASGASGSAGTPGGAK